MKLEPGTLINDRYTIIEQIGLGGMAVVYRARDEKLGRDVTFKVLREEHLSDNEFIKRFNVEARAAASLSHPNIVSVYDVGNDGDIYFIVMEYVDGCTLKELINRKAPFDNQEVISISLQVASALEHAHANGIIHRDIKPQNILVSGSGKVKVTDFGLARAASSTTTSGDAMGSVQYFSPEQAKGGFVDAKSDIYSMGIMMFEMITGTLPFDGDTPVALAMKHIKDPLPDISKLNPNASASLIKIINKATQKRPYARYQTVSQLIADLKAALKDDSGKFVKINEEEPEGQTIAMSDEELKKIRNGAEEYEKKSVPVIGESSDIYNDVDNDYNPLDDGYDKDKERKVVIVAVITALALIVILTVIGVFVINQINNPTVKVPDFEGMTVEDAEELAQDKGVSLNEETEHSEEVEEGIVISQDVEKNTRIPKDDKVTILISLGSEMVEVPSLKDLSEEDAEKALNQVGLEIGETIYEPDETVIVGAVIRQSIDAGTKAEPGTKVDIYVSTGPEAGTVIVPDVLNMEKDKAVELLEQEDLEAKLIEDFSDTYAEGRVSGQGVKAGSAVPKGYIITLTVSKGSDPNAVTEPQTQATTQQIATVEPTIPKKAVSIPILPDFDTLGLDETVNDPAIAVKVVANTADGARTVVEGSYNVSEFPFTVNDQIDKDTTYEIYYNNTLVNTVNESY